MELQLLRDKVQLINARLGEEVAHQRRTLDAEMSMFQKKGVKEMLWANSSIGMAGLLLSSMVVVILVLCRIPLMIL